jgi:hypothetical protein
MRHVDSSGKMIQFAYPDARVNRDDDPDDSTITAVRVGAGSKSACWPQLSSSTHTVGRRRHQPASFSARGDVAHATR